MPNLHGTLSRPIAVAVLLAAICPLLGSAPAHAAATSTPPGTTPGTGITPPPGTPPRSTPPPSDRLLSGQTLQPGQSLSGGHDTLTMQANGNLVLTAPGHTPLWSSSTSGNPGARLALQPNGNLAVIAASGQSLWSAGTARHAGAMLILQPNGNLVVTTPANTTPPSSSPPPSSPPPSSTAPPSTGPAPLKATPARTSAPLWTTNTFRQTYADIQLTAHGWSQGQARQFGCLDDIWTRESKWDEQAGSPAGAYGIPQASPGAKMAAAGPDWLTSPQTQIRWGEDYIAAQYGTPCQAWAHWQVHKSY